MKNRAILLQSTKDPEQGQPAPVAHNNKIITLSENESLPLYYKIIDIITLSTNDESVVSNPIKKIDELLTFVESLGGSKNRRKVLRYLLVNRAASPPLIRDELSLPEPSAYRTIDELVKLGYIVWATPTKINWKRQGYSSGIVAVPNFTPEDLVKARSSEVERVKPQSKMVQKAYQLILDEYSHKESPTRTQILGKLKPVFSGFSITDIMNWIDGAIELAQKNGTIKVWR